MKFTRRLALQTFAASLLDGQELIGEPGAGLRRSRTS